MKYSLLLTTINPAVHVRGIFLDISKAFDKVWQDGLLFKLKTYGVAGLQITASD